LRRHSHYIGFGGQQLWRGHKLRPFSKQLEEVTIRYRELGKKQAESTLTLRLITARGKPEATTMSDIVRNIRTSFCLRFQEEQVYGKLE